MLSDLITIDQLESLAGKKVFWRGRDYFAADAVGRVRVIGDRIKARVEGTESYQAELWDAEGELGYDCSCPHAADGYFCKHCVALGLAWLGGAADLPDIGEGEADARPDPLHLIRCYLETLPAEILISLLMDTIHDDDRLYQSLLLKAERGRAESDGDRIEIFRRAIDTATQTGGYLDWHEAGDFARDLDAVVDSLEELLEADSAVLLVELSEYAIERIEEALQEIDDSSGEVGGVLERLSELHREACEKADLDPTELAECLFRMEMQPAIDLCGFGPLRYSDALGATGLKRYRELVEEQWRELGPRGSQERYDSHRVRITSLMEQLARADGDIEELIEIRSRDLTSSYRYLDIAELWVEAGQPDRALEWAERGLAAFPDRPDSRLRDFLAAAYLDRGRQDEALQLTWIQFEEYPSLVVYQKLAQVAERIGIWPAQRERALAFLEESMQSGASAILQWPSRTGEPNYSTRLQIALWEKDLDAALATVERGRCESHLLITLAGELEASRADAAVGIYRRVIPPIVEQTNNRAYDEAIRLLRKVGDLMKTLDRQAEHLDYLRDLRVRYKPKRNFIKLLDGLLNRVS
ncbi:DUF6880 family protein [Imhoffiella purpurea]|uniref:SWIM-type domain-containing protein n=1 Tax=Imhoffiella purpurea TaxID=1249627 RepID=W9VZV1_9GAMM|nr:DUF6880 family protein [Imhoffiella purpurea]EXJ15885.1 hypothetical protein D779_0749 [Imhoffiella purpurea]